MKNLFFAESFNKDRSKNNALLFSCSIFVLFALVHFLRVFFKISIIISGYVIPIEASLVAGAFAIMLALWMLIARYK